MTTKTLLIIGVIALAILVGCVIVLAVLKKKEKSDFNAQYFSKKDVRNHLYFLTRIYLATPLVKRYYRKVKNRYRAIFPADEVTLTKKTTERMTFCLAICLGIMVVSFALCKGDVAYMAASLLACYILFTNLINSSEQKMQEKLLDQLDLFISELNSSFHNTGRIDDAISDCMDNLPYEISLHADIIRNIVSSTNVEEEVEKYVDVAPNKYLLLLAAICSTVSEYGNKTLENGRALFAQNLNHLKSEANNERERIKKKVNAFSGKVYSVLIPIFCLKPIELAMASALPDIKNYYQGAAGVVSMAIIIAIIFVCYEAINILKDERQNDMKEDRLFKIIAEIPSVKRFLSRKTDHNYTKAKRISDMLKTTGNIRGINVFTVKRFMLGVLIFVITNVVCISAFSTSKKLLLTDFSQCYTSSLVRSETDREKLKEITEKYSFYIQKDVTREVLEQELIKESLDDKYRELIITELLQRKVSFDSYGYKAYMLLLAIALGVVGYYVPYWLLKYKQKITSMNRDEEVAQFRTLILILMHQDGMTLDKILEWMEKFAHSFKASISDCIINLEYSEEDAINQMIEEDGSFPPFRRLCNSFKSIDGSSLEVAFGDLETEHAYYQEARKIENEKLLKSCSNKAGLIEMIPIMAIMVIYLVLPFLLMVVEMYQNLNI